MHFWDFGDIFGDLGGEIGGSSFWDSLFEFFDFSGGVDILGGASRVAFAEEWGFARAFGFASDAFNLYYEYDLWKRLSGNENATANDFKRAWGGMSGAEQDNIKQISKAINAHGFLRHELGKHAEKEGLQALLSEYEQLALDLPSEKLLKKVYHALGKVLHPDKNPEIGDELFKALGNANTTLQVGAEPRVAYERLLSTNPEKLEELVKKMSGYDWDGYYTEIKRGGQKLLGRGEVGKFQQWVEDLTPGQKAGWVVGILAAGAAVAYGVGYLHDQQDKKEAERLAKTKPEPQPQPQGQIQPRPHTQPQANNFTQRINQQPPASMAGNRFF